MAQMYSDACFLHSLCDARVLNRTMKTCYAVNVKQDVKFSPYERSVLHQVGTYELLRSIWTSFGDTEVSSGFSHAKPY